MEVEQGPKALRQLVSARSGLDARIDIQVRNLRERGATWEHIGAALGITKQGASQPWGNM